MPGHPNVITADTSVMWDGVAQRLARGTIIDVTPGSALETAIGREYLAPITGTAAHGSGPVPETAAVKEAAEPADGSPPSGTKTTASKTGAAAKAPDDGGGGKS